MLGMKKRRGGYVICARVLDILTHTHIHVDKGRPSDGATSRGLNIQCVYYTEKLYRHKSRKIKEYLQCQKGMCRTTLPLRRC